MPSNETTSQITLIFQGKYASVNIDRDSSSIAIDVSGISYIDSGLTPNTSYIYTITPLNSVGESGLEPIVVEKSTLPLISSLTVLSFTETEIVLAYDGSYNNVNITRNGTEIVTSTKFTDVTYTYTDSGLTPNTLYTYIITPKNSLERTGTIATITQSTLPNISLSISSETSSQIELAFSGNYTTVDISRDGSSIATGVTTSTYTDSSGLIANTSYTYVVIPYDASGDVGDVSGTITKSTLSNITSINISSVSEIEIDLLYTGNYENVSISRNGTIIATDIDVGTYTDTGLIPNTLYTYVISPYNIDGIIGIDIGTITQSTLPLLISLSIPSESTTENELVFSGNYTNVSITRDGDSIATGVTGTTYTDSGLPPNNTYEYIITPYDASGDIGSTLSIIKSTLPNITSIWIANVNVTSSQIILSYSGNYTNVDISRNGVIIATGITTPTYTDNSGLSGNTYYTYDVTPYNSSSTGSTSSPITQYTLSSLYSVIVSGVTTSQIVLEISGNYTNVSIKKNGTTIATNFSGTTYTDSSGLNMNTNYNYEVTSYNISGIANNIGKIIITQSTLPTLTSLNISGSYSYQNILQWTGNYKNVSITNNGTLIAQNIPGTTYTDSSGIIGDASYTYIVIPYNSTSNAGSSRTASKRTLPTLTSLSVSSFTNVQIVLSYPGNYTNVSITRNTIPIATHVSGTTYTDVSGLIANTSYTYVVTPYNLFDISGSTLSIKQVTLPILTTFINDYSVSSASSIRLYLRWTGTYKYINITRDGSSVSLLNTSNYLDQTQLSINTSYVYVAIPYNSVDISGVPITITAATMAKVTNILVPTATTTSITIQPYGNYTSYNIYRGGNTIATGITDASYTDTGLTPYTSYTYIIKSYNPLGLYSDSNTLYQLTNSVITSVTSTVSSGGVILYITGQFAYFNVTRNGTTISTNNGYNKSGTTVWQDTSTYVNDTSYTYIVYPLSNPKKFDTNPNVFTGTTGSVTVYTFPILSTLVISSYTTSQIVLSYSGLFTNVSITRNGIAIATNVSGTTYTDSSGVSANTQYIYQVTPYNADNITLNTAKSVTTITLPNILSSTFSNITTTSVDINVTGNWQYLDISNNNIYKGSLPSGQTNKTDTGLQPNTSYSYILRPINANIKSGSVSLFSLYTLPRLTSLTGISSSSQIVLTFVGSYKNVSIRRDNSIIATNITGTTYTDSSGIISNTSYTYYVTPYNQTDISGSILSVIKTTFPSLTSLSTTSITDTQVVLSFPGNYTSVSITRNGATIATNISGPTYTNSGLGPNQSWTYIVTPKNSSGLGSPLSITTKTMAKVENLGFQLTQTTASQINVLYRGSFSNVSISRNGTNIATGVTSFPVYTDSGLTGNTSYTYIITPYNSDGSAGIMYDVNGNIGSISTTEVTKPNITSLSISSFSESQIVLSFPGNFSNVTIIRKLSSIGSNYSTIANVSGTTYTDTDVQPNTSYTYNVTPYNSVNISGSSITISKQTLPQIYTFKNDYTGGNTTATTLLLRWTANSNFYNQVKITRDGSLIATFGNNTYNDCAQTSLSPNTSYTYVITPYNSGNIPGSSITISAATLAQITGLISSASTTTSITLQPSGSFTSYNISRGGSIIATGITTSTYTDTGLSPYTSYIYVVSVYNPLGIYTGIGNSYRNLTTKTNGIITSLSSTVSASKVTLNIGGQYAYFNITRDGNTIKSNGTGTSFSEFTISNYVNNASYTYVVYPLSYSSGTYDTSSTLIVYTWPKLTSLSVSSVTASQVVLVYSGTYTNVSITRNGNAIATNVSGTTYTDSSGLISNTYYTYVVTPYNADNITSGTQFSTSTTTLPNMTLSSLSVSSETASQIVLSFSGSYTNVVITRNGITVANITGTTFTDTGLTANTSYTYIVTPTNGASLSGSTSSITQKTLPNITSLSISSVTASQVVLLFGGNYTDISITRGGTTIATGITGTTYTDSSGLSANTSYLYIVTPNNSVGSGSTSSITGKTLPNMTSISVSSVTASQIVLAYTGNYTSVSIARNGISIATGITTSSYTDSSGLISNTSYVYIVTPINSSGSGTTTTLTQVTLPNMITASVFSETTTQIVLQYTGNYTTVNISRNGSAIATNVSGSTYTDSSGLTANTTYAYSFTPINSIGSGSTLSTNFYTLPSLTATPGIITVSSIQMTFSGSYSYVIVTRTDGGSTSGHITGTTYTDSSGLSGATLYSYNIVPYTVTNVAGTTVTLSGTTTLSSPTDNLLIQYTFETSSESGTSITNYGTSISDTIVTGSDMSANYTTQSKVGSGCFYKNSSGTSSTSCIRSLFGSVFTSTQPLTLCFWYKSLVTSPTVSPVFQAQFGSSLANSFQINGNGTSFIFQNGSTNLGAPTALPFGITNVNDTTNWYHIIMTLSGTTVTWYINNSIAGTPISYSGITAGTYTKATIGTTWTGTDTNGSAKFLMDDFRFYTRVLTSTERTSISGIPTITSVTVSSETPTKIVMALVGQYTYVNITRNGTAIAAGITTSTYTDSSGLTATTSYTYVVTPYYYDASGASIAGIALSTILSTVYSGISAIPIPSNTFSGDTGKVVSGLNTIQNGSYTAMESSFSTVENAPAYLAYNGSTTTYWHCKYSVTYTQFPYNAGVYQGGGTGYFYTTSVSPIGTVSGEWMEIILPYYLQLTSYKLLPRNFSGRYPVSFNVVGSNDGNSWYNLDTQTNLSSWTALTTFTPSTISASYYQYFRIIFNKVESTGTVVAISQWDLTGNGKTTQTTLPYLNTMSVSSFTNTQITLAFTGTYSFVGITRNGASITSSTLGTTYTDSSGLSANTSYTYVITPNDSTNSGFTSTITQVTLPVLTSLSVSSFTTSQVILTFVGSYNNLNITRNGTSISTTATGTTYTDTGLTAGTSYTYVVTPKNSAGIVGTTILTTIAVTLPTITAVSLSSSSIAQFVLALTGSYANVTISRNGNTIATGVTTSSYTDSSGFTLDTNYVYVITPYNSNGIVGTALTQTLISLSPGNTIPDILWYKFETGDISSNNLNLKNYVTGDYLATCSSGNMLSTTTSRVGSGSLFMSGATWVSLLSTNTLVNTFTSTQSGTYAIWFNCTSATPNSSTIMIPFLLSYKDQYNEIGFAIKNSSGNNMYVERINVGAQYVGLTTTTFLINTWNHFAITVSNTSTNNWTLKAYLNGNLLSTSTSTTLLETTAGTSFIGSGNQTPIMGYSGNSNFIGYVDDFRAYTYALTLNQVQKISDVGFLSSLSVSGFTTSQIVLAYAGNYTNVSITRNGTAIATNVTGSTYMDSSGLTPNTFYTYVITPNNSTGSAGITSTIKQFTLPNLTSLSISSKTASQIVLAYTGNYYSISITRGGTTIATGITGTTYTDSSGLSANTSYTYVATPYDASGDSGSTLSITQNTLANITSLSVSSVSTTQIVLAFSGNYTNFSITRGGTGIATNISTSSPYTDSSGLTPNTSYAYVFTPYDLSGNAGSTSSITQVTMANITSISITSYTATQIVLAFAGNYTNVNISRGGTTIATNVSGSSYTDSGLTGNTSYTYLITPNNSATTSGTAGSITQITLPNITSLGATSTATTITLTYLGNFTNVSIIRDGSSIATGITASTYTDTGLTLNQSYTYIITPYNSNSIVGTTSSITKTATALSAFQSLLINKPPWGQYNASMWNAVTNKLPDLTGNGQNATTTTDISNSSASGNGATVTIPYINGGTSSIVQWPTGSIPTTFTIASLTRYSNSSGNRNRILNGSGNWLHGHWNGNRGVAYYEGWVTNASNIGTQMNWLNMIGTNSTTISTPNNILVDGSTNSITNGGTGGEILRIGINEASDFQFSQLFVWNQPLTISEMSIVSNAYSSYLSNGLQLTLPTLLSLSYSATSSQITLTYLGDYKNVRIIRDGSSIATGITTPYYIDSSGLSTNTSYTYIVTPYDTSGNSGNTSSITVKTSSIPSSASSVTARYFKWSITAIYDMVSTPYMQISEISFLNNGTRVSYTGATASDLLGTTGSEGPLMAIDNNTGTKWLSTSKICTLLITFPSAITMNQYQLATGGDAQGRDPVSWILYYSTDNVTWNTFDTRTSFTMPTARSTYTSLLTFSTVSIPSISSLSVTSATSSQIVLAYTGTYATVSITNNGIYAATNITGTTYTNTGLTSNTLYTYTVTPYDASGALGPTLSIITKSLPGAPTSVSATTLTATSMSISFTASSGTGITNYTVTSSPGGFTGTGSTSPITISGLTANTSYTFTVTATTLYGTSTSSTTSTALYTLPNITTAVSVSSATTSQIVLAYAGIFTNVSITRGGTIMATGITTSTYTDSSGLTANTSYTYIVTPYNVSGVSGTTSTITITTPLSSPTIGTATVTSATSVSVSFTPPSGTVTSYTITSSPGNLTGTGSTSPISVSGLTPNTAYTFTVTATNSNGTSVASSSTTSVITLSTVTSLTFSSATISQIVLTYTGTYTNISITRGGTPIATNVTGTTYTDSSGLTTNTPYIYVFTPYNSIGVAGSTSTITSTTVSDSPTIGTATVTSSTAISVAFTPPSGTGTITSYTVTSSPGNFTGTGSISPISVSGLTPNTAYTFTVKATNSGGTSVVSSASTSVVTLSTISSLTLSSATTSQIVLAYTGTYTNVSITRGGTPIATNVTGTTYTDSSGLTSNTPYIYVFTPYNSSGVAGSTSTTTLKTLSDPPTIGTATVSSSTAISVTFTPPSGTGAITGYTVTSSPSNITGTGSTSPISVSGLSPNTAYTFTVTATNSSGTSSSSGSSSSVVTLPALTTLTSSATNTQIVLTYSGSYTNVSITRGGSSIATGVTGTTYTDTTVTTSSTYTYVVTPYNSNGVAGSTLSNTQTAVLYDITTNLKVFLTFEQNSGLSLYNDATSAYDASMSNINMLTSSSKIGSRALTSNGTYYAYLPALDVTGISDVTICFWYKHVTPVDGTYNMLFRYYNGGSNMFVSTKNNDQLYQSNDHQNNFYSSTLTVGNWYHIAAIWSSTTSVGMTMYVNGGTPNILTGAYNQNTSFAYAKCSLFATTTGGAGGDLGKGTIDNYRVYFRALTAGQISYLYSSNL